MKVKPTVEGERVARPFDLVSNNMTDSKMLADLLDQAYSEATSIITDQVLELLDSGTEIKLDRHPLIIEALESFLKFNHPSLEIIKGRNWQATHSILRKIKVDWPADSNEAQLIKVAPY
jgi:hypothetical protein